MEERKRLDKLMESLVKDARENASNLHVMAMSNWIAEFTATKSAARRYELNKRLPNIYRLVLADLRKKDADFSAHLSNYHQQQYRKALEWRSDCLSIIAEKANSVGR